MKWNVLMAIATIIAAGGSVWVLLGKGTAGMIGIGVLITLFVLGLAGFVTKTRKPS